MDAYNVINASLHNDLLTAFNVYNRADDSAKKTEMDYITGCFTDLFDNEEKK